MWYDTCVGFSRIVVVTEICGFDTNPSVLPRRILGATTRRVLRCNADNRSIVRVSRHSGRCRTVFSRTRTSVHRVVGVPSSCTILFLRNNTSARFTVLPLGLVGGGGGTSFVMANR